MGSLEIAGIVVEGLRGFPTDCYTRPSERRKKKRTCGSRKAMMNLRMHACCLLQSEKRRKTRGRANERVGAQRSGSIPEDRQATLRPRGTAKIRFNQIDFNQREEPRVTPPCPTKREARRLEQMNLQRFVTSKVFPSRRPGVARKLSRDAAREKKKPSRDAYVGRMDGTGSGGHRSLASRCASWYARIGKQRALS